MLFNPSVSVMGSFDLFSPTGQHAGGGTVATVYAPLPNTDDVSDYTPEPESGSAILCIYRCPLSLYNKAVYTQPLACSLTLQW